MRKLVVTQNITLDGSVEMIGDWFDPQGQGESADLTEEMVRQDQGADALVVGRDTFESFRGYWRDLEDDTTGVSDYLNGVQKYVVSRTLTDAETDWEPTTVLADAVADVGSLKDHDGLDIVCTGSISLTHTLIGAGLVDEYRLFVYPAVQGRGRRLFPDGYEVPRLVTLESRTFAAGITLLRYGVVTAEGGA